MLAPALGLPADLELHDRLGRPILLLPQGAPIEAVGRDKQQRVRRLAARWLDDAAFRPVEIRFDVASVLDGAVEVVHPLKDLHVTLLHLLGLNDNQLTYFHEGRYKQLSQTGRQLIRELLA